jgi:hypothetical protein
MLPLLAKIGLPQSIGLYFDGPAMHATVLVATPFGRLQLATCTEPFDPEQPAEAVRRLLSKLPRRGFGRTPVAIGVPVEETYFTSRPINVGGSEASPRVLLREALRSPNVHVDDMTVDVVKSQPDRRCVASIVACKSRYIEPLVKAIQQQDLRLVRAEPAASALLRVARRQYRPPRKAGVVVRVFLSQTHLLAVFTAKHQPLMWRRVQLPRGDEASAIVTSIRSLVAAKEHCGVQSDPSLVVIHGRPDLKRLLDLDWVREQANLDLQWTDEPALDSAQIALGLAEGCFETDGTAFDLARRSKTPARLRDLVPWPEIALFAALVALMACFLFHRLQGSNRAAAALSRSNSQNAVASLPLAELQKEKNQLQQRVVAVKGFLDTRILWSACQRELSDSLPDNIFLTSVQGTNELATAGKKGKKAGPKKSLILKGAVVLPDSGVIPHEIDRLLTTLRNHPALTRDFAVIELAELKRLSQTTDERQLAMFTVVCLPKGAKKGR